MTRPRKIILFISIFICLISCRNESKNLFDSEKVKSEIKPLDSIKSELQFIYDTDQELRFEYENIEKEYGWESIQAKELWKEQSSLDSINLIKVNSILDKYGWLGIDEVGKKGNSALFLVIQHSDLSTQLKYLPILEKATDEGKASKIDFAMLKDRVLMSQNEKQIYGTQLNWDNTKKEYYVASMIEPEKINERRKSVGLGTIEDYIAYWNLEWDLEKYKKRIKRIENENK